MIKVKDTNLINVKKGDILMYRSGSFLWPDWDVLGGIIRTFEGNEGQDRDGDRKQDKGYSTGDYTHCVFVTDLPDPEAEVVPVGSDNYFKIKEVSKKEKTIFEPTKWHDQVIAKQRLVSNTGVRTHATWPCVRQDAIDWENPHMEVWRIKRINDDIIDGVLKLVDDMLSKGDVPAYQYDISNFITFGNIHLPSAKICSQFIADPVYYASMLLGNDVPICLTPDIDENRDKQITPNDIINSGEVMRIRYQGLKNS
jgi:hypothetical protein